MNDKIEQDGMTSDTGRLQEISLQEGRDLKTIREAHGITLQDIFHTSRVSVVNLDAIETGNYGVLPPSFIAKSFIQTYARAIGVNAETIISHYEQYMKAALPSLASPGHIFGRGKLGSSM